METLPLCVEEFEEVDMNEVIDFFDSCKSKWLNQLENEHILMNWQTVIPYLTIANDVSKILRKLAIVLDFNESCEYYLLNKMWDHVCFELEIHIGNSKITYSDFIVNLKSVSSEAFGYTTFNRTYVETLSKMICCVVGNRIIDSL